MKHLKALLLAGVSMLALVACSQSSTTTPTMTVQDVQNQISAACNYVPTIESIVAVATTVTTAVDPAAGATAQIAVSIGNSIVTEVCKAVQAQTASTASAGKPGTPHQLTVTVNGKQVTGQYTPGGTKT